MSTITTINEGDNIKDSRSVINTNFANLNADKIETSYLDTDTTLAANSDVKIPSQKAVKAYADAKAGTTFLVPTGAIFPFAGSSAPTNYLLCDGSAVSRSTYTSLFSTIGTTYGTGNGSTTFNLPNLCGRIPVGVGTGTIVGTFVSRNSNVVTLSGLTDTASNEFQTGQAVVYHTTGGAMTGLVNDTTYYLIRTGNLTFSLATSLANAIAGTAISLSSDGTGTQTFTLTLTARTLGQKGGEENHSLTVAEMPAHTHPVTTYDSGSSGSAFGSATRNSGSQSLGPNPANAGGSGAHNNMPPFIAINYIIKT